MDRLTNISLGALLEHCKEDLFEVLASYFPVDYEPEEASDDAEQSVPITFTFDFRLYIMFQCLWWLMSSLFHCAFVIHFSLENHHARSTGGFSQRLFGRISRVPHAGRRARAPEARCRPQAHCCRLVHSSGALLLLATYIFSCTFCVFSSLIIIDFAQPAL